MKAVLINPADRRVAGIELKTNPNRSLAELRELIGCELVQPLCIGENLTLWLDEEGKLKQGQPGFRLAGIDIDFAGNGILLGGDADRVKACKANPDVVAVGVRWLAAGAIQPPQMPKFVFI